jgi:hypothetical protein
MSSIVERQSNVTVEMFESFESSTKLARHFIDVIEKIGGCVLFRTRCLTGRVLLSS